MTSISSHLPKGFITSAMKLAVVDAFKAEATAFAAAVDQRFEIAKALGVIYSKVEDAVDAKTLKRGAFKRWVEATSYVKLSYSASLKLAKVGAASDTYPCTIDDKAYKTPAKAWAAYKGQDAIAKARHAERKIAKAVADATTTNPDGETPAEETPAPQIASTGVPATDGDKLSSAQDTVKSIANKVARIEAARTIAAANGLALVPEGERTIPVDPSVGDAVAYVDGMASDKAAVVALRVMASLSDEAVIQTVRAALKRVGMVARITKALTDGASSEPTTRHDATAETANDALVAERERKIREAMTASTDGSPIAVNNAKRAKRSEAASKAARTRRANAKAAKAEAQAQASA